MGHNQIDLLDYSLIYNLIFTLQERKQILTLCRNRKEHYYASWDLVTSTSELTSALKSMNCFMATFIVQKV